MNLTDEQKQAIGAEGKVIVSASAGSGKTFVMIAKLADAIVGGVDLDEAVAVTFTNKAAEQMKEKLRAELIGRMKSADKNARDRLKIQLSKIASANICTIHSLCAKILRTYFYAAGVDSSFDIISSDDAVAAEIKKRAIDEVFDAEYAANNPDFKLLLKCFYRQGKDENFKKTILSAYQKLRAFARYDKILKSAENSACEEQFDKICAELSGEMGKKAKIYRRAAEEFFRRNPPPDERFAKLFAEMLSAFDGVEKVGLFGARPPLCSKRPTADKNNAVLAEYIKTFDQFRKKAADKYADLFPKLKSREEEYEAYLKGAETAAALAELTLKFDGAYAAAKRAENKLDYEDLEHFTLALLSDDEMRREISGNISLVFVDEYQDVNPVQEEILSLLGGDKVFYVGDVKQAIYGFRGSRSRFFAEKFSQFGKEGDGALKLTSNFRSAGEIVGFVNAVFSQVMTVPSCGFDYAAESAMVKGAEYPQDFSGYARIHVFGKDEKADEVTKVYSVKQNLGEAKHTREGLAVLAIVERELQSEIYDIKTKQTRPVRQGDICILARKRADKSASGIIKALTDAGYSVSGAQQTYLKDCPEVRQMLDILSYIDNSKQDIPMVTALLSPVGGFSPDELAAIKIACAGCGKISYRKCCEIYAQTRGDEISAKLKAFYARIEKYVALSEILTAAQLIDEICESSGLEAMYSAGGGAKLKNLRRLADEGEKLALSAFLKKMEADAKTVAPSSASTDSIKFMTIHSSKGLEAPIVILADICARFTGGSAAKVAVDDVYGFANGYYDLEKMSLYPTVLTRLANERVKNEELKNELNLFYVACTRAMCRLHVMAEEAPRYDMLNCAGANSYSALFDMSGFVSDMSEELSPPPFAENSGEGFKNVAPDPKTVEKLQSVFMRPYAYLADRDLAVKTSASAILRLDEQDYYPAQTLFKGEGETGAERGIAYHRFLELADFSLRGEQGVKIQLENMLASGNLTRAQYDLLSVEELTKILDMPVFGGLAGYEIFREREFLCSLPARDFLDSDSDRGVLVQGAIDLMAKKGDDVKIVDYKYSSKDDAALKAKYSRQLDLYEKAVKRICGEGVTVSKTIVNIRLLSQIDL